MNKQPNKFIELLFNKQRNFIDNIRLNVRKSLNYSRFNLRWKSKFIVVFVSSFDDFVNKTLCILNSTKLSELTI